MSLAVTHKPNSSRVYSLTRSVPVISFPVHSSAYCVMSCMHCINLIKKPKKAKNIFKKCIRCTAVFTTHWLLRSLMRGILTLMCELAHMNNTQYIMCTVLLFDQSRAAFVVCSHVNMCFKTNTRSSPVYLCADGELFTATKTDFRGIKPQILRYFSKDGRPDVSLETSIRLLEGERT